MGKAPVGSFGCGGNRFGADASCGKSTGGRRFFPDLALLELVFPGFWGHRKDVFGLGRGRRRRRRGLLPGAQRRELLGASRGDLALAQFLGLFVENLAALRRTSAFAQLPKELAGQRRMLLASFASNHRGTRGARSTGPRREQGPASYVERTSEVLRAGELSGPGEHGRPGELGSGARARGRRAAGHRGVRRRRQYSASIRTRDPVLRMARGLRPQLATEGMPGARQARGARLERPLDRACLRGGARGPAGSAEELTYGQCPTAAPRKGGRRGRAARGDARKSAGERRTEGSAVPAFRPRRDRPRDR